MEVERISWSYDEVEKTVASYFAMLDCELRGQKYSKSQYRELLLASLRRPKGGVEFKHQNISAVLLELGLPYINGYKPRGNYQDLLKRTVVAWVSAPYWIRRFLEAANDPVAPPMVPENLEDLLMPAPKTLPVSPAKEDSKAEVRRIARKIDYAHHEAMNRLLGKQGEEFILNWEVDRLRRHERDDLARRVEWVSETQGDGLGFDIASFDPQTEEPIAIEVKTTRGGQYSPFFVTYNEAEASHDMANRYRLYRLFSFAIEPRLFILPGPLERSVILEPYTYRASLPSS